MNFFYKDTIQLNEEEIIHTCEKLETYRQQLKEVFSSERYYVPESSICLTRDVEYARRIESLADKFTHADLKYVVVVGIGGSSLGTKALYEASRNQTGHLTEGNVPELIFLETIDEFRLKEVNALLQDNIDTPDKIVINLISKSGMTTESLFNFERIFLGIDVDRFSESVVVSTDEDSPLWIKSEQYHFHRLAIPKTVGGRYSVFSAVGQFPLRLVGFDVNSLLNGARAAVDTNLTEIWKENIAGVSAATQYLHYKNGLRIHDNFLFSPDLEFLGKWYRQLVGESIGKVSRSGVTVGITPTVSIGTTDLHSVAQLYLGGPVDRITTFISANTGSFDSLLKLHVGELIPELKGTNAQKVKDAMYQAVKTQYLQKQLPYNEITLTSPIEYELGFFMQTKMIEIMYLAKLLEVNAFDQPDVEWYKQETRRLLS